MFHEEIINFSGRNFQLSKPPLRCNYVNSCWLTAMLDDWFYLEPMTVRKLPRFSVPLKVKLLIFYISIVTDSSLLSISSVTAIDIFSLTQNQLPMSVIYSTVTNTRTTVMFDSLWPYGPGLPGSVCPWDFPGKNTGVGCRALLQGIFLTQGSNPHLFRLLHWQADSLPLVSTGKTLVMLWRGPRKCDDIWEDLLLPL